jgi:hypothetical protein
VLPREDVERHCQQTGPVMSVCDGAGEPWAMATGKAAWGSVAKARAQQGGAPAGYEQGGRSEAATCSEVSLWAPPDSRAGCGQASQLSRLRVMSHVAPKK